MATVLDSLKVILGLDANSFHAEIKKVKNELQEVSKEQKNDPKVIKKAEEEKQKILDKSVLQRRKNRKKETEEVKKERKKEVDDLKKDSEEVEKTAKKSENKSIDLVSSLSKRFALAYVAKKAYDFAKESAITSGEFERLESSMMDSSEDMRTYANQLELVGGNAAEAKDNIVDLQTKLDRFHLFGEGAEELAQSIGLIGVNLYDTTGKMKSALEVMDEVKKYITENPQKLQQSQLYQVVSPFVNRDQFYEMTQSPEQRAINESRARELAKEQQGALGQKAVEAGNLFIQEVKTIPSRIANAVVGIESGGNSNVISPKGAQGKWQVMPDTFKEYANKLGIKNADPFNPEHSEAVGSAYLKDLSNQKGGWGQGSASYNMGPNYKGGSFVNGNFVGNLPRETEDYLGNILQKMGGGYSYDSKSGNVTNINGITMNIHGEGREAQDVANKVMQEINRLSIDNGGNNMGMQ